MIPVPVHVRDGAAEQSVYLLVGAGNDERPTLRLLPDTHAVQSAFAAMDRSMYFWRHNATTGQAPILLAQIATLEYSLRRTHSAASGSNHYEYVCLQIQQRARLMRWWC